MFLFVNIKIIFTWEHIETRREQIFSQFRLLNHEYPGRFQGNFGLDDVANWTDNCRDTYNPGQEDGDGDGTGDACESQYSAVANAEAAVYGSSSLVGSGATNSLALLLIPFGAVIFLRIVLRKKWH